MLIVFQTRSPEKAQLGIKSKSLEERKDNYDKVKSRIFKDSSGVSCNIRVGVLVGWPPHNPMNLLLELVY